MTTITFSGVPNQLTAVHGDPANPGAVTAYVGPSYVENGFTFSGPNNLGSVVEFFPASGITLENPNPLLNGLPIVLTRDTDSNGLNGDLFGVTSIALDSRSPIQKQLIDFVGIDANGVKHETFFTTDIGTGFQFFQLPNDFQSNLVSLAWSGVLLDPITGQPVAGLAPIASQIVVTKTSASTVLDSVPAGVTAATATFKFSSDDPGASFQYKLDNATTWTPVINGADAVTLSGLTGGEHTFRVAAVNAAGIVDPSPAQFTWFVDTGAAVRTIGFNDVPNQFTVAPLIGLSGPSYVEAGYTFTGSLFSSTDTLNPNYNLFSTGNITLTHGGDLFGVSSIKLDGFSPGLLGLSTPAAVAVIFSGTDWLGHVHTATFTTDAQTGLETFTLPIDFQTGLKSFSWSGVDTIADDIVVNSAPDTFFLSEPPATTSNTTATFKFAASEPGVSYQYTLDNASISLTTTATNKVALTGLSNGTHTIQVAAVDANGFVDPTPAQYTWTVDPNATAGSNIDVASISSSTLTVQDLANLLKAVKVYEDNLAGVDATQDPTTHAWTATLPDLSQGPHEVSFTTTDKAGHVSPLFDLGTVTIDTIPPTSTISEALTNDTGISHTDLITTDGRVTVSGKASEPVNSVEIWNANTKIGTATIDPTDQESWSFTGTLGVGTYQLYAKLTDLASNVGQTSPQATIDVVAAPILVADRTGVNVGASITVKAANGVLANDHDPAGQPLQVAAVNGQVWNVGQTSETIAGTFGSLTLNLDGSYTYTASSKAALPASGVGEDVFTYTAITSQGGTQDSTLTVNVMATGLTYVGPTPGSSIITGPNGKSPVLDGGAGNLTLVATNGATVLIGGPGDTLTGGKGADTYVFLGAFGKDTITNYTASKDIIELDHTQFKDLAAVKLAATQAVGSNNTVITDKLGDTVTLTGVSLSQLHFDASHFLLA